MRCPICGTYDINGRADTGNPISQNSCINGHRFKTAMFYKIEPSLDFNDYDNNYQWSSEWQILID